MRADDSWQVFCDAGWRLIQQQNGFTREDQCSSLMRARAEGNTTIGEAIAAIVKENDEGGPVATETMLRWIALFMLDELPMPQRLSVLRSVGERDPPSAAIIQASRNDLSEAETSLLRAIYYPSMPVARAKDQARG